MPFKCFRAKQSSHSVLISTLIASSSLLSIAAHAETQPNQVSQNFKNDSSLIQSISNDPMFASRSSEVRQPAMGESAIIHQINQELGSSSATKKAEGVSSISQLSDVRPTDWAFTALQSLVERYGCTAGYPDRIFRGRQSASRYEFASGLNACLGKINEIISAGLADKVSKEDLAMSKKLQEEFAAELVTIRGRVNAIDAKTAKLEAQQFSTTTKLYGQAIFGLQGRANNSSDILPRGDGIKETKDNATNITFGSNLQLSLVTQFDSRSILVTGISAGNISTGVVNSIGVFNNSYTRLGYESDTNSTLRLSDFSYRFLANKALSLMVGVEGVSPITVFRGPNRYESAGQGSLSAFAQRNPILNLGSTRAGVGFDWQISDRLSLQGVYAVKNPESPNDGLFGGGYTYGLQLTATPIDLVDFSMYYLNSYGTGFTLGTGLGDDFVAFPPASVQARLVTNAIGGTVNWQIARSLILGGWIGLTSSRVPDLSGSVETFNWMAYLNFPDLFREGNLGGIYIGQPTRITSSNLAQNSNIPLLFSVPNTGEAGGQPNATTHAEIFYRHRITDNISITLGIIFIFNPFNSPQSDTISIGAVRTTFTF